MKPHYYYNYNQIVNINNSSMLTEDTSTITTITSATTII